MGKSITVHILGDPDGNDPLNLIIDTLDTFTGECVSYGITSKIPNDGIDFNVMLGIDGCPSGVKEKKGQSWVEIPVEISRIN